MLAKDLQKLAFDPSPKLTSESLHQAQDRREIILGEAKCHCREKDLFILKDNWEV